uniref:Sodium channel and clathrin linker 1 n=1 Tax=Periophthalmus magnuspinnatus TaxID=409849 RepID=A0A3B3ZTJ4_9GOBI
LHVYSSFSQPCSLMCSSYNLKHCSIMAPLIDEYDRHIKEMMEELQKYQVHLVYLTLDRVVKENERLHTELRESVERQLHAIPVPSATKGSAVEEDIIIKNLQEQIQLSEQQAMEFAIHVNMLCIVFCFSRSELNRQKQRSHELELQLETDRATIAEYERQLAEYKEKSSRLQLRLTQAEQKATAATHQFVARKPLTSLHGVEANEMNGTAQQQS